MAYQVGTTCFPDAAAALSVISSDLTGNVVSVSGVPYSLDVVPGTGSLIYTGTRLDQSGSFQTTVPVTLQDCELLTGSDALEMSWMVVSVWAVVFAVLMMRRGI